MDDITTIWTLNKAYDLIAGPQEFPLKKTAEEVQQELCNAFDNKIQFGQRPDSGNQLMPDKEYFVPIAPKCIGSYFDSAQDPVKTELGKIETYYNDAGQSHYKTFWDQVIDNYQMQTKKYQGYYSIIEQNPSNILIGYSQGGLVTRYLNWLDKEVFKKNLIKGVITLSSPNFGSPLANQENAKYIFRGFWDIILVLLGKEPGRSAGDTIAPVNHDNLLAFIKDLHIELNSVTHLKALASEDQVKKEALSDLLMELYNWLGGLRNDPDNAFYDLNLMRMEPHYSKDAAQFSVLASISQPTRGIENVNGIISANWHSKDILYDAAIIVIIDLLKKCLHRSDVTSNALQASEIDLDTVDSKLTESKFDAIDEIFMQQIMTEHHSKEISNPLVNQVINWHENGVSNPVNLDPHAHDFVIPSAYQLTLNNDHSITAANHVNAAANHLSGSSLTYEAGRENRATALACLKKLVG